MPDPTQLRTNLLAARQQPKSGVLGAIGNTPLIRVRRYLDDPSIALYLKLESANPGGSAKARPALRMIEHALAEGILRVGATVIESSSGNMGIGLAQACRYHGLRFICVVDRNAQAQNLAIMRALGAEVRMVEKALDGDLLSARIAMVEHLVGEIEGAFWPNQYANPQNPLAHQEGTVREIDEALAGALDILFVATSSTGTAGGCQDYLESRGRKTSVVAVDAEGSVLFAGKAAPRRIPGLGAGRVPELAMGRQFAAVRRVTDLDCVVGCRRMAEREAMLVGGSAGGVLETIYGIQDQLSGLRVAAILHDSGTPYLDTVFNEEWVEQELGASPIEVAQRLAAQPNREVRAA